MEEKEFWNYTPNLFNNIIQHYSNYFFGWLVVKIFPKKSTDKKDIDGYLLGGLIMMSF